jgi:hypothetical protein
MSQNEINEKVSFSGDLTLHVGINGDYTTVQEALDYISTLQPTSSASFNVIIDTGVTSANVIKFVINNVNLGWGKITAEDDEVIVPNLSAWIGTFQAFNSIAPIIDFNLETTGGVNAVIANIDNNSIFTLANNRSLTNTGSLAYGIMAHYGSNIILKNNSSISASDVCVGCIDATLYAENVTFTSTNPYHGGGAMYPIELARGSKAYLKNIELGGIDTIAAMGAYIISTQTTKPPIKFNIPKNILTEFGIVVAPKEPKRAKITCDTIQSGGIASAVVDGLEIRVSKRSTGNYGKTEIKSTSGTRNIRYRDRRFFDNTGNDGDVNINLVLNDSSYTDITYGSLGYSSGTVSYMWIYDYDRKTSYECKIEAYGNKRNSYCDIAVIDFRVIEDSPLITTGFEHDSWI